MADRETMAAYAANTEAYRQVVSDAGGNSMLDGFLERLPPLARVLDFGCGVGNCAAAMQAAGLWTRVPCGLRHWDPGGDAEQSPLTRNDTAGIPIPVWLLEVAPSDT